jgi:pimeloyl-ACP methyl ester carboxylesterase
MNTNRRQFLKVSAACAVAAHLSGTTRHSRAYAGPITPLEAGAEVDDFKAAQRTLLDRYEVSARSRYIALKEPALTAHVLDAGVGDPVLMLHGGGQFACQFAPLMAPLQKSFHVFAVDRPGCGLTDKVDYRQVALRQHAIDFVGSALDALDVRTTALIGSSMGGLWALLFALEHPERVTSLVLVGEPAWSSRIAHAPPPASRAPTIEGVRAAYAGRLVADVKRVPEEMIKATLAANRLPGAADSWDTLITKFLQDKNGTYHLRPELKNLRARTLFVWGDGDKFGPPTLGQEMAVLAPDARCEVLADAGHLVWLDQPERCARSTMAFLTGRVPAPSGNLQRAAEQYA